jgi:hypothetical protein
MVLLVPKVAPDFGLPAQKIVSRPDYVKAHQILCAQRKKLWLIVAMPHIRQILTCRPKKLYLALITSGHYRILCAQRKKLSRAATHITHYTTQRAPLKTS